MEPNVIDINATEESLKKEISNIEQELKEPEDDFVVDAWTTSGKIDYTRLVKKFGTEVIDDALLEKFKRITGKDLHPWLKRGIYFSHRGLNQYLDAYENGDPIFLYTGRGPTSDAMHIGHLIPFLFCKWLQDVLDCPLVIQISDEEKAAFKKLPFEPIYKMGFKNAKEIIACGFNPEKTFIFSNRDYRLNCKTYEKFASEMKMQVPLKTVKQIFGLTDESTIAMYDWPFYQTAAAFYQAYPHIFGTRPAYCLIPCAIDQDPYFRMGRDIASKMNLIKPCTIMCTFIPPLSGNEGKMSATGKVGATLFLNDDEQTLRAKIMENCYSGGGGNGSLEDHRKYGGNPDIDIAYQYLKYFEQDDEKLKEIHDNFKSGKMTCGEIKEIMAQKLSELMGEVRKNREAITDDVLSKFYEIKPIQLPKPKEKKIEEAEGNLYEIFKKIGIEYKTKYHAKITTPEEAADLASSVEGTICKALLLKAKDSYILYVVNSNTRVDTKKLPKKIDVKTIRFAESDTYSLMLKVNSKTCPSLYALSNDKEKQIKLVLVDLNIPKDQAVNFFAMREEATTTISYGDMIKFIEYHGYPIKFIQE